MRGGAGGGKRSHFLNWFSEAVVTVSNVSVLMKMVSTSTRPACCGNLPLRMAGTSISFTRSYRFNEARAVHMETGEILKAGEKRPGKRPSPVGEFRPRPSSEIPLIRAPWAESQDSGEKFHRVNAQTNIQLPPIVSSGREGWQKWKACPTKNEVEKIQKFLKHELMDFCCYCC